MEIGSGEEGEGFEKDVKTSIYVALLTSLITEYQVKTRLKFHEECCNCISVSLTFLVKLQSCISLCSVS